jgi:hypothetical protein
VSVTVRPDRECGGVGGEQGEGRSRAEIVPKSGGGATYLQVSAWAAAFCKSVGVCLRRFESCTCHTAKRASDLGVCRSGALRRCRGDQCSRVLPHNFPTGSRRRPDSAGHSRPSDVGTCAGHPARGAFRQRPATA